MKKLRPVVTQDVATNNVLMLAWADAEALRKTRKTGFMHYWSRSRGRHWKKGETSGHVQKVVSLHEDCDRDAILARVEQTGPACHRGTYTCFAKGPFPPADAVARLEAVFAERKRKPRKGSHTSRLLADPALLRSKVLEEAAELILAARSRKRNRVAEEAADLLYHVALLLFTAGVSWSDALAVLDARRR